MEELVAIAKVVKPRGLRGEAVADVLTDFPERFEGLGEVVAVGPDGGRRVLKIEDAWFQKGRVIFKFDGVDSVEAAEELRNTEICVPESEAVDLESDEYYDWQLEGCTVVTPEGVEIGTVKGLMRPGGTELLVVEGQGREFLIPFAESICTEVDIGNKKITADPPEGLLEF